MFLPCCTVLPTGQIIDSEEKREKAKEALKSTNGSSGVQCWWRKNVQSALLTWVSFFFLILKIDTHEGMRENVKVKSQISPVRPPAAVSSETAAVRIRLISDYDHFNLCTLLQCRALSHSLLSTLTLHRLSHLMATTRWRLLIRSDSLLYKIAPCLSWLGRLLLLLLLFGVADSSSSSSRNSRTLVKIQMKKTKIKKRRLFFFFFGIFFSLLLSIDVGSLECTKWPMAQLLHCLSLSPTLCLWCSGTSGSAHKWHKRWAIISSSSGDYHCVRCGQQIRPQ